MGIEPHVRLSQNKEFHFAWLDETFAVLSMPQMGRSSLSTAYKTDGTTHRNQIPSQDPFAFFALVTYEWADPSFPDNLMDDIQRREVLLAAFKAGALAKCRKNLLNG